MHQPSLDHREVLLMLTRAELQVASGYKRPSRIREWLDRNAIGYVMPRRRDRWPRVLRSAFEKRFDGTQKPTELIEPDFSWLRPKR